MSDHQAPDTPGSAADDQATQVMSAFSARPDPSTAGESDEPPSGASGPDLDDTVQVARATSEAPAAIATMPPAPDRQEQSNPGDLEETATIVTPLHAGTSSPPVAATKTPPAFASGGVLGDFQSTLEVGPAKPTATGEAAPPADTEPAAVQDSPATSAASKAQQRTMRLLLLFGGSVLLLTYLIAVFAAGSGVPRGTTVLGINIGGMSSSSATEKLEAALPGKLADEITLVAGETRAVVRPADAGLSIDYAATVAAAGDSSLNPFTLFGQLGRAKAVEPVVHVDDAAMGKALDALAEELAQAPREGAIAFVDGAAEATLPQVGRELDKAAARLAIARTYGTGNGALDAPVTVTEPEIGAAEVERAMAELAEPAVSAPISLDVDGQLVELAVKTFASALSMKAEDGRLNLVVDGKKLHSKIRDDLDGIEVKPKDAAFQIVGGQPQLVPSRDGKGVAPDELAAAVLAILPKDRGRVAEVDLKVIEPELTTAEAKDLGVVERVSTWTTNFDYAEYRAHNIGQAARYLNGALVLPGEEFSFNDRVGERTEARGFVKGIVISGGAFDEDWGGGVSAVATTTFNAVFYAGLKDIEHHPHSFWITRYPKGTEATVAWGAKDLRFFNDSDHGVYIQASATSTSVTVTFWGTKKYNITRIEGAEYNVKPYDTIEKDRCVPQSGMRGFDIDVWRVFYQDGSEVKREKFTTHYIPADEIICEEVIKP